VKHLSGLDGAFLSLETAATPMHVGSLHVFQPPPHYRRDFGDGVKQMMASRMHLAPVLSRRIAQMPLQFANPVWIDDGVDLDFHIQRIALPSPGTMQQLQDCVGELHGQLLDRSRPMWMLYVLDGLGDGRKAYYFKIHHSLLDGQAGAALAAILFDLAPDASHAPAPPARSGDKAPGALSLAAAAFRHDAAQYVKLVRNLPEVARTLAGMVLGGGTPKAPRAPKGANASIWQNASFGPRTALNVALTPERGFAGVSIPLDEVKAIAHARGATVNDVVLALCSGALRRYLTRHGGLPRKPLMATMPISLRAPGNKDFTTQATLSLVNLATDVADPLKRLDALRAASGATKAAAKSAKSIIPVDFPTIGGPWIIGAIASLYGRSKIASVAPPLANVVISNVAGPPIPLYAAGARMTDYWPLSIVEHGVGLNITLMSYNGSLGVGFTVASCAVPDAHELVADFLRAHAQLKQAVEAAAAAEAPVAKKPRARAAAPVAKKPRARAAAPVAADRKARVATAPKTAAKTAPKKRAKKKESV
jgi:diacylglycerol O-acyltransferase / wax synthase